jgi:hypothetical protein
MISIIGSKKNGATLFILFLDKRYKTIIFEKEQRVKAKPRINKLLDAAK